MARLAPILSLFIGLIAVSPTFGDDRFTTISIINQTPEFQVAPSIEIFGQPAAPFVEQSTNNFSFRFKLADDEWFDIADIKLHWKDAYQNNDGTKSSFDQRIQLRLRYPFPPNFTFNIYFSNKRSQVEMSRLEHQIDDNQQWENYFRGWQIADYYRKTNDPQYPLAQRASWIFFNAADQLAEKKDYFVVMSPDAIAFEQEAFKDTKNVLPRINTAKSAYWEDLPWVDKLLPANCSVARILLTDLQAQKIKEPDLFTMRYPSAPNVLNEKMTIVNSKCPQP
jgi:hypothetical protein